VDADSATFTVQVDNQEDGSTADLAGVSSPAHFLPAVGDEVTLALAGARPMYQPGRVAAGAIGMNELSPDVTLQLGNGNTVTYSPDPPTGSGTRSGDIWWQTSGSVIVGAWQWDGTTWQPHTFGDETLDSLTAAKITSGQIAAGTVVDVGDPAGEHTEITDSAIKFVAPAPDGTPVDVTQLGRQNGGVDSATGLQTWAIDEKGAISGQDLSVTNDPIFQGTALSALLDGKAEFQAGASLGSLIDPAQTPAGGGEVGFYEFTVELEQGHIYWLLSSNMWPRPASSATTQIDVNVRATVSVTPGTDPPPVSTASALFARAVNTVSSTSVGHPAIISHLLKYDTYAHFRFLICLKSTGGPAYFEMGNDNFNSATLGATFEPDAVQLAVIDLGEQAWTNRAVLNSGGGTSTPPAVKRYTYDYYAHWSRSFVGGGATFNDNSDCYQGQTTYYPANGNMAAQIGGFSRPSGGPSLHSDLQGATVESLQVWLYANHWESYDGGTAVIRYHNNATAGSLNNYAGDIEIAGWARNQGRWVDITSWASLFQGTGAQGIQVGPAPSTDPTYYGIFDGPAGGQPPIIRATFTK
jgi:hypothetical protein